MKRRNFIQQSGVVACGLIIAKDLFAKPKGAVYGHNGMKYRIDTKWGELNPEKHPVKDCMRWCRIKKAG